MKELEKALREGLSRELDSLDYKDKQSLYDLYSSTQSETDNIISASANNTAGEELVVLSAPAHKHIPLKVAFTAAAAAALISVVAVSANIAATQPVNAEETAIESESESAIENEAAAENTLTLDEMVHQKLGSAGVPEEKISEYLNRLELAHVTPELFANDSRDWNVQLNSYGELVNDRYLSADLIGFGGSDPDTPRGYVYRGDLGYLSDYFSVLLPEERDALEKSEPDIYLRTPDPETGLVLDWVYAFNEEGTEIVGKFSQDNWFVSNKELEDPEIAKKFCDCLASRRYEQLVSERIAKKLETGSAVAVPYTADPAEMPAFDAEINCCIDDLLLSENATAECSDPSVLEIKEIVSYKADTESGAASYLVVYRHNTATVEITIKDGDKEYKYKTGVSSFDKGYLVQESRIS